MPANEAERSPWQRLAPLTDLVTPMAVRVAATLGLADLMADGPRPLAELAAATDTDAEALARLLAHLVCHGVFSEPASGRFGLTEISELLRSDHSAGAREWFDLDCFGGRMDLAFTELLHTIRTGRPAWEQAFGMPFWEYLAANPGMAASFDANMARSPRHGAAVEYDWSGVEHVVDVGGGTGALLADVLEAHPGLRGTLVDLPATVARGRELMSARGLAERCAFVGQSFFDPLPPGGDAYILSAVLHDWPDAQALAILRNCRQAAGAHGRVLILESHGTAGDDPAMFAEMSLRMLVLAGGRERSIEQYGLLCRQAGLSIAAAHTTTSGHVLIDGRAAAGPSAGT